MPKHKHLPCRSLGFSIQYKIMMSNSCSSQKPDADHVDLSTYSPLSHGIKINHLPFRSLESLTRTGLKETALIIKMTNITRWTYKNNCNFRNASAFLRYLIDALTSSPKAGTPASVIRVPPMLHEHKR